MYHMILLPLRGMSKNYVVNRRQDGIPEGNTSDEHIKVSPILFISWIPSL